MKEITRVHIAKQAYDIEIDAKKQFEKYMKKLEQYAGEPEILADIEIRITELLADRGVQKDGVITAEDVAKIRKTLGEPEDFADTDEAPVEHGGKRLYRDMDGAIVAGVLSGIGKYFAIDPLWIRLVFVVLLLVSFGTMALLYVVLWLVVPPARTATEKLQLAGLPVTLEALRERATTDGVTTTRFAQVLKALFFVGGGIASIAITIGILVATVSAVVAVLFYGAINSFIIGTSPHAWMAWAAFWLLVVSGLLLAVLMSLIAGTLLKRRLPRRMAAAMVTVVIGGLLVFSTAVALTVGYTQLRSDEAQAAIVTRKGALPELANIRKVVVVAQSASGWANGDSDRVQIDYRVTSGTPRYELRTQYKGEPMVNIVDGTARITMKPVGETVNHFGYTVPQLTIYGPALESIDVQQGSFAYMLDQLDRQEKLAIKTLYLTNVTTYGTYESIDVQGSGDVDVSMSSVRHLAIDMEGGAHIEAGVVHTLSVAHPDACPAQSDYESDGARPQISVQGISSGEMTYNGVSGPVRQYATPCGEVAIKRIAED